MTAMRGITQEVVRRTADVMQVESPIHVLQMGAGHGLLGNYFSRNEMKGVLFHGYDCVPRMRLGEQLMEDGGVGYERCAGYVRDAVTSCSVPAGALALMVVTMPRTIAWKEMVDFLNGHRLVGAVVVGQLPEGARESGQPTAPRGMQAVLTLRVPKKAFNFERELYYAELEEPV